MLKRADDLVTAPASCRAGTEECRLMVQLGLYTVVCMTVTHKGLPYTQSNRCALLVICALTKRHWTETEAEGFTYKE